MLIHRYVPPGYHLAGSQPDHLQGISGNNIITSLLLYQSFLLPESDGPGIFLLMYDRLRNCFRSVPADLLYYQPLFLPGRLQSHIHLHKQTNTTGNSQFSRYRTCQFPLQSPYWDRILYVAQLPVSRSFLSFCIIRATFVR